jgi:hypothetical protein
MCVGHDLKNDYSLEQKLELLAKMGIRYTNCVLIKNSENN